MSISHSGFGFTGSESIKLPARRENFSELKEWLSSISDSLELPVKMRKQLLIVSDEIFTNISSYGYPLGEGTVEAEVAFDEKILEFSITFSDEGIPYNPLETPDPDIHTPLAERAEGGLGVFIVKKLMDTVDYRRDCGKNILVMKKKLPKTD
ncbi:MAG: ATP-binding protein [Synergistes sp.]|nr:ATP-binding protein [Synergistes sp.]